MNGAADSGARNFQLGQGGDNPADFKIATGADDYVKRDVMIPMRDGVKLHTVIVIPKGAARAPMILDRTPYNASKFASNMESPRRALILPARRAV